MKVILMILDNFGGHGNSFHGAGGRNNKRAQMHHCLRLMRSMVSTNKESVLQDFVDQGAINQINSRSCGESFCSQMRVQLCIYFYCLSLSIYIYIYLVM